MPSLENVVYWWLIYLYVNIILWMLSVTVTVLAHSNGNFAQHDIIGLCLCQVNGPSYFPTLHQELSLYKFNMQKNCH